MRQKDRIAGGLYGLLIGDALGVPYEFHRAEELPAYEEIEMVPPKWFGKTYIEVEAGTWSDDGAQALCLLDSLLGEQRFSLEDYADFLSSWYEMGTWAVDEVVFDVGNQTGYALNAYQRGVLAEECGMLIPEGKGNGALMRVLPLALWHSCQKEVSDKQLVLDAHRQCLITHGHICNQVCCALYCLTALFLLEGKERKEAIEKAVERLRDIYQDLPEYEKELEWSIRPEDIWEGKGSGYVVDCLRSAFMILLRADSYEDAVKQAVLLGDDTDTTACVTGGLAGIYYGVQDIPIRWMKALKEQEKVAELLSQLIEM